VSIPNSSAASQAVGPPPNAVEMSCDGRLFAQIGRKLLGLRPLGQQAVSPTDSVLGRLANPQGTGLTTSYAALIQQAFQPDLWNATQTVMIGNQTFSQMEANFSLFWGLSIQLYESTLVSDDTPLDRFEAGDSSALTSQQQQGLEIFEGKGRCESCHKGPLFTEATTGDGGNAFTNTGVRPVAEDTGEIDDGNGRFKTPTLRNVEFTGPYFHNGGQATLRQVVDFYDRGGDFPSGETNSAISPIGLTDQEKDALVAFLLALSDDRVRFSRAPFDHPALCVPNGEEGDSAAVTPEPGTIRSRTTFKCIPANGAAGVGTPLTTFLGLSPFRP
jgi:cytochrome c peroxidase